MAIEELPLVFTVHFPLGGVDLKEGGREGGKEGMKVGGREGGREGGAYLRDVWVETASHHIRALCHLPIVVPLEEGVEEGLWGVPREGGREGGKGGEQPR